MVTIADHSERDTSTYIFRQCAVKKHKLTCQEAVSILGVVSIFFIQEQCLTLNN